MSRSMSRSVSRSVSRSMSRLTAWLPSERYQCAALFGSGVVTGLCLCFPVLGLVEWLSLVPALLVWLWRIGQPDTRLRELYADGLWFHAGLSLTVFHFFLYMYPLEFTGLYELPAFFVVMLAWLGLSLLQSLFGALVPLALGVMARGRLTVRHPWLVVPAVAALWCVREWCQTLVPTGVPWARLGIGESEVRLMLGTARWFGSYGITFLLVAFNACIAYALLHAERRRLFAVCAAGVLSVQLACGATVLLTEAARTTGQALTVAAVQGNIGSLDKWRTSANDSFYHYYNLSHKAVEQGTDIIVWPETAVPKDVEADGSLIPQAISELIRKQGDSVLLAGYYIEDAEGNEYNAVRAYDADGTRLSPYYAKRHPVPFGEYVPLRRVLDVLVPPLTQISQLSGDITPGKDSAVFDTAYGHIGSLICFDSIYERSAIDSVRDGAQLLAVSTNDSWFYDSAAVSMHNAQAKLRAVETGRYVVRAANTGISTVITPTGKETARLEALEEGVLYGEVELRSDTTLYVRTGNVLAVACLLGCLALLGDAAVVLWHERQKKGKTD